METRRSGGFRAAYVAAGAALLGVIAPGATAWAQASFSVVMSGLNNPRGLAFGQDGGLYVTEAGVGGAGTAIVSGGGETQLYGTSSSISRLLGGVQSRVLTGAPSLAATGGNGATGIQDLVFVGNQAYGLIGFGADPALRSTFSASETGAQNFGKLVRLSLDGTNAIQAFADIAAYETASNPDSPELNSNPYSFAALGGGAFAVTDAGGNDLLRVTGAGVVSTLSVIPARPNPIPGGPPTYQSVPTGMTVGADGNYYFGELTGYPFVVGAANIYRYNPTTGARTVAYAGFTNLVDLAFAVDGSMYALELTTNGLAGSPPGPGVLTRISPSGTRTVLENQQLLFPTALTVGADGAVYVSDQGNFAGTGRVLRFAVAVPEPGSAPLLATGAGASLVGMVLRRRRRSARRA